MVKISIVLVYCSNQLNEHLSEMYKMVIKCISIGVYYFGANVCLKPSVHKNMRVFLLLQR